MTDVTAIDYRRTDLRTNVLENPYWITSGEFTFAAEDLTGILFSFPAAKYTRGLVLIHAMVCQITTAFATGTITVDIGSHTLATDAVTTGGVATLVDIDEYIDNTEITHGTLGFYFGVATDYAAAVAAAGWVAPAKIVPADATVPIIGVSVLSSTTSTAGAGRIHMLISEVPGV